MAKEVEVLAIKPKEIAVPTMKPRKSTVVKEIEVPASTPARRTRGQLAREAAQAHTVTTRAKKSRKRKIGEKVENKKER